MTDEEFGIQVQVFTGMFGPVIDSILMKTSLVCKNMGVPYGVFLCGMNVLLCKALAKILAATIYNNNTNGGLGSEEITKRTEDVIREYLQQAIDTLEMLKGNPAKLADDLLCEMLKNKREGP